MTRRRGVVVLTGAVLLGNIAVVLVAGCGRKAVPRAVAFAVPRAVTFAAPETIQTVPDTPPAEPTAEYPSLEAVRDTVEAILRRAVSPADTAIHFSREKVQFKYWYADATAPGWALRVVVTDTTGCPNTTLEDSLPALGWARADGYQTDGPDGGDMGFVTRRFFCLVEARWDGGDDTDTTYVPAPGCDVTVTCVPRRDDDVPPR